MVPVVAALHLAVVSFAFGPRCIAYIVAAYLSAVAVWGAVFLLSEQRHQVVWGVGLLVVVIIQQIAYRVWKAELPGFWWPLGQFGALHFPIAVGISEAAKWGRRTPKFGGQ
jgi:hypothetical protein